MEPSLTAWALPRAKVVAPQDLSRSIMYLRLNSLDTHKMPPLARNMVDKGSNFISQLTKWPKENEVVDDSE